MACEIKAWVGCRGNVGRMPWKRGPDAVLCGSDAVEAWVGCRTPKTPISWGLHIAGSPQKPPIGAVRRPPNDMPGKIWSRARQNGLRMLPESVGRMPYFVGWMPWKRGSDAVSNGVGLAPCLNHFCGDRGPQGKAYRPHAAPSSCERGLAGNRSASGRCGLRSPASIAQL